MVETRFAEGKDLVEWLEKEDILFRLSCHDAEILLGYLEESGHGLKAEGMRLYLCKDGGKEGISIDDVVDKVCEMNFSLIQDNIEKLAHAGLLENTDEVEAKLKVLYKDERRLDKMFERTCYYKGVGETSLSAVQQDSSLAMHRKR